MEKHTIILANSCINDFMGPDDSPRVHIGHRERTRLLGEDRGQMLGRLPLFLQEAAAAQSAGANVHTVLVRDLHDADDPKQQPEFLAHGHHALIGTPGADFVPQISHLVGGASIINVQSLAIPLGDLRSVMSEIIGRDFLSLTEEERENIQIILMGAHTDKRVFGTANLIRNTLEFPNVYVSPHLMASNDYDAHRMAVLKTFPGSLIKVVQSTRHLAMIAGMRRENIEYFPHDSCQVKPQEAYDAMTEDQRMIVSSMFMDYDDVYLESLAGGFSGSLLLMAQGVKGQTRAAPMVVKIDKHDQIGKEMDGYNAVKHLMGNAVPTFSPSVTFGDYTGIAMELASMEGQPVTMQKLYEGIKNEYTISDTTTYLIDCLGYSESDCDEMTFKEMLFIINDGGHLLEFQKFTN